MSRIIAVVGATGQQGGAVAKALLKSGQWKVRGLTRNTSSKSARALAASGIEVVAANIDDIESLVAAFSGAYGVYGVTNFWEHLFSGKMTPDEAGEAEAQQAKNIALACSRTSSLQHYVFSTLQQASEISKGKRSVAHMDHKSKVDDWMRRVLPDVAAKTTYMWLGFYPSNLAFFPLMKPFEVPLSSGKYMWYQASSPDGLMPLSGDVNTNVGVVVAACFDHPDKSHGKYINVTTDVMKMRDLLSLWSEISGRQAVFVEASDDDFERLWGVAGHEMATQYRFGQENPDWEILRKKTGQLISWEDVGVKRSDLLDTRGLFESLHAKGAL